MSSDKIFKMIDVHALSSWDSVHKVMPVVNEHGFRGVVINELQLKQAKSYVRKDNPLKLICAIDYMHGALTTQYRCDSIMHVIKNGANEIEVSIQENLFHSFDIRAISEDIRQIGSLARAEGVSVKYKINPSSPNCKPKNISEICRALSKSGIAFVTNAISKDQEIDDSETIIFLRDVNKGSACETKAYIKNATTESFLTFYKSGVTLIGLDWKIATKVAYDVITELAV